VSLPPAVFTTTSTSPGECDGVLTVMLVEVTAVTVPATPPKVTLVVAKVPKLVPRMMTV